MIISKDEEEWDGNLMQKKTLETFIFMTIIGLRVWSLNYNVYEYKLMFN